MIRLVDDHALVRRFPDVETARIRDVLVTGRRLPGQVRNVSKSTQTIASCITRHRDDHSENAEDRCRKTDHFWNHGDGAYCRSSYHFLSVGMAPSSTWLNDPASVETLWMPEAGSMRVSASMACQRPNSVRNGISRLLALPLYLWRKVRGCFGDAVRISEVASDGLSCKSAGSGPLEGPDSLLSRFAQRQRQNAHHRIVRDMPSASKTDELSTRFTIYPQQQQGVGEIVKITTWANNGRLVQSAR